MGKRNKVWGNVLCAPSAAGCPWPLDGWATDVEKRTRLTWTTERERTNRNRQSWSPRRFPVKDSVNANIHETVVIELLMKRRNSKFLFRYSANEWCNNATMQLHNSIWMRGTGRWIPRAWCRGVWLCAGGSTREHQPAGQGNWPPCAISDAIKISLRTSISVVK